MGLLDQGQRPDEFQMPLPNGHPREDAEQHGRLVDAILPPDVAAIFAGVPGFWIDAVQ
jgi:hypothetical protein